MSADGYAFGSAPSVEELGQFDLNDFGNAMRLCRTVGAEIDEFGNVDPGGATLLYVRDLEKWIGWNGRHWDLKLGQRLAQRTAHKVAQGLSAQYHVMLSFNPKGGKEIMSFIKASGNAGKAAAMLEVAEGYLQVELDAFDNDPLALTVQNGTLKFRRTPGDGCKVIFAKHDPADRITRMAHVDYDPKAKAPVWESSLAQWQPLPEMQNYLQRLAGYVATGHIHEQVFVILQGKGRDGKSTFVGALRELLGDYAGVSDVKTFLDMGQRSGSDASPDLARLAGDCRLVSVAEPPRGAKLAEAMIKSFTGGAPILARFMRKDPFDFLPKPKVLMECNSRPVIRGDDEGIWRRVRLIMFERQVAPDKVDKSLAAKLRAEYSGILNWIIVGVGDWLNEGLREPKRLADTMDDYRKGSSPFGEWFMERCELEEGFKETAKLLFGDYKEWCEENGLEKPMSQTAFGNALADRQVIRCGKDVKGNVLRMGARLKPKFEPALGSGLSFNRDDGLSGVGDLSAEEEPFV